jgi:N-acyl homoserine lactone hydrolase
MTPAPVSLPLAGGSDGASVELELLRCGECLTPPGWFYRQEAKGSWRRALGIGVPKTRWLRCPIGAVLVRHPSAGTFLIDTGLHARAATDLKADFGRINGRFFNTLKMDPGDATTSQLAKLGIGVDDVELVVMTHLHVDHTSAMPEFRRATFVCTRSEWEATGGRTAVLRGYVKRHLPPEDRVRTLDLERGTGFGPFSRTADLFGDGSVRLISTPGHTVGHLSVLLRLADGEAVVAGDAIYTLRSLRERLISWRTAGDDAFLRSVDELRAYADENPSAPLIATHDAETWDTLSQLGGEAAPGSPPPASPLPAR